MPKSMALPMWRVYGRRILGYGHAEDCRCVEDGDGGLGRGGGCEGLGYD